MTLFNVSFEELCFLTVQCPHHYWGVRTYTETQGEHSGLILAT